MIADQGALLLQLAASMKTQPSSASQSFTSPASRTAAMAASQVNEMPKILDTKCKAIIRKELVKHWLVQTLGQNKGSKRKEGDSNYGIGEGELAFDVCFRRWTANRENGVVWETLSASFVQPGGVSLLISFSHALT